MFYNILNYHIYITSQFNVDENYQLEFAVLFSFLFGTFPGDSEKLSYRDDFYIIYQKINLI